MNGKVDLTRTDLYEDEKVPEQDIETCMKVLRTIAERYKRPDRDDREIVAVFESTHELMVALGRSHNRWVESREMEKR